jgi:hypothetical protein
METAYSIDVEVLSADGGAVDIGTFAFEETLIVAGIIKVFSIKPQDYGVGMYPVFYDFKIQPSGELYAGSFLVVTLPDDVVVYDERSLERDCSYNIDQFTFSRINCKVNGNVITINSGFTSQPTTVMTDNDTMDPPILLFSLPQFWNPRSTGITDAFALSIYSEDD